MKAKQAASPAGTSTVAINIPELKKRSLAVYLLGDSPLVCHQWSEKAKKEMRDKQTGEPKGKREPKNPWMEFCSSLYWLSEMPSKPEQKDVEKGHFGFPAIAFKAAAVDACSFASGVTKVLARGAFYVASGSVEIFGDKPKMREDMVRIGMGTADLRYRGEFTNWWVKIEITYNVNVLSEGQIINLFNQAGFSIGVGEGRPQKDRDWGRFHVATAEEMKKLEKSSA